MSADMADDRGREADAFYLSDSIREIDEEAPFIRLQLFQELKSPVAVLCVDAASAATSLYTGYVKKTNYEVLEIATLDGRLIAIETINADFYPLPRADAPAALKAITTEAYAVGMRFHTGKLDCYFLVQFTVSSQGEG
jgi:hypothetical protein